MKWGIDKPEFCFGNSNTFSVDLTKNRFLHQTTIRLIILYIDDDAGWSLYTGRSVLFVRIIPKRYKNEVTSNNLILNTLFASHTLFHSSIIVMRNYKILQKCDIKKLQISKKCDIISELINFSCSLWRHRTKLSNKNVLKFS